MSKLSIRCPITIHSNQGQRRTLSSSIRRSFKAWANWRVSIQLKKGATPFCLSTPRRVPLSLTKKVQEEIKRMEQLEVSLPRISVYCYVSVYWGAWNCSNSKCFPLCEKYWSCLSNDLSGTILSAFAWALMSNKSSKRWTESTATSRRTVKFLCHVTISMRIKF